MWTKEAVNDALKSYLNDKARALHLAIEISELARRVNSAVASLESDETGPNAQVITGMPHGNKISTPTEDVAIRLADGWLPPEIKEMQEELQHKQTELEKLQARVKFVEAWMGVLTEREHWIVLHQYIRAEYWRDILDDYSRYFGQYASKDTLKRLRTRALNEMYAVARVK